MFESEEEVFVAECKIFKCLSSMLPIQYITDHIQNFKISIAENTVIISRGWAVGQQEEGKILLMSTNFS